MYGLGSSKICRIIDRYQGTGWNHQTKPCPDPSALWETGWKPGRKIHQM